MAPPKPNAAIAAPDHFPMLRRNKRLFWDFCSFSEPISEDGKLFISKKTGKCYSSSF
jgi:hypothetical protein